MSAAFATAIAASKTWIFKRFCGTLAGAGTALQSPIKLFYSFFLNSKFVRTLALLGVII